VWPQGHKIPINHINMFFVWNVRGLNSDRRHTMTEDWINIHRPLFGAFLETHILESNTERIRRALPFGWQFFGNYGEHEAGRIVVVWDPQVSICLFTALQPRQSLVGLLFSRKIFVSPLLLCMDSTYWRIVSVSGRVCGASRFYPSFLVSLGCPRRLQPDDADFPSF